MTKNSALAVSRQLDIKCDEPYMFAVMVGKGCFVANRTNGDGWGMLTLFINLIERTMVNLSRAHQDDFRRFLARALQDYLAETYDKPTPKTLSGKQLAKRQRDNQKILDALTVRLEGDFRKDD